MGSSLARSVFPEIHRKPTAPARVPIPESPRRRGSTPNPPPAPGSGDAPLADDPAGPTRLSRPPPQPRRASRGHRPSPGAPPGAGPHPQRTSFHSQIASRRRPRSPPHPHRRTFAGHCIPWLGCTRPGSPISQLTLQLHAFSLVLRCRSFDPLHWCARPDTAGWALCELRTDQWLDQQQFTVPTRLIPPGTRSSLSTAVSTSKT
nr:formin-like protein 20 [Aegilops tauschii subsp. strangulata]